MNGSKHFESSSFREVNIDCTVFHLCWQPVSITWHLFYFLTSHFPASTTTKSLLISFLSNCKNWDNIHCYCSGLRVKKPLSICLSIVVFISHFPYHCFPNYVPWYYMFILPLLTPGQAGKQTEQTNLSEMWQDVWVQTQDRNSLRLVLLLS